MSVFNEWKDVLPSFEFLENLHLKSLDKNKNTKLILIDYGAVRWLRSKSELNKSKFDWNHSESDLDQLESDQILITTNIIQKGILQDHQLKQLPNSCWGGFYSTVLNYDKTLTPSHAYNCFINRLDPIRQSWLYQLVRRNILTEGLVSFNMDVSRHYSLGQYTKTTTPIEIFNDQFEKHCKNFQMEHDYIKEKIPFRNFDDFNLNNVIMKSKFSIVLETYFDDNRSVTYSEKIFRCLKLPRPWILFAMKGAVAHLRNMGFDVLDDVVDHSYDNIDNTIERQSMLLDLAQQLGKIEYTPTLYARLQHASESNQNLLVRFNESFKSDCIKFFEEI
jgi:hypothetical protein